MACPMRGATHLAIPQSWPACWLRLQAGQRDSVGHQEVVQNEGACRGVCVCERERPLHVT